MNKNDKDMKKPLVVIYVVHQLIFALCEFKNDRSLLIGLGKADFDSLHPANLSFYSDCETVIGKLLIFEFKCSKLIINY